MGWIKHNGISVLIQDGTSPADYHGLVGVATADMIQFRETWGDDGVFAIRRCGDLYQLQRINGEDRVIMGPVPSGKPKFPGVWMPKFPFNEMPVPAYDIFANVGGNFLGWYVNPGMTWEAPAHKFKPHPDYSVSSSSYDDPGEQFDSGHVFSYLADAKAYEIFVLRQIGTPDLEDADYEGDSWDDGGEMSPGLETPLPPYIDNQGCCANAGCCICCTTPDPRTCTCGTFSSLFWYTPAGQGGNNHFGMGNSVNTYSLPHCMGAGNNYYVPSQSFIRNSGGWGWDNISMNGEVIASGSSQYSTTVTGSANIDCGSQMFRTGQNNGTSVSWMETSAVVGVDGYTDYATWIGAWKHYQWADNYGQSLSPWAFAPYMNDWPTREPFYYTLRYYVTVRTPTYSYQWEFADPEYGNYGGGGSLDSVDIWRMRIFDFHGQPVFVFTWRDDRDDMGRYCLIFNKQIYFSPAFEVTFEKHEVYDADAVFDGGIGKLHGSAIGLREYTHTEDGI